MGKSYLQKTRITLIKNVWVVLFIINAVLALVSLEPHEFYINFIIAFIPLVLFLAIRSFQEEVSPYNIEESIIEYKGYIDYYKIQGLTVALLSTTLTVIGLLVVFVLIILYFASTMPLIVCSSIPVAFSVFMVILRIRLFFLIRKAKRFNKITVFS